MTNSVDRERYQMRKRCSCGSGLGYLTEVGGQDIVRCLVCGRHCYNAPRTETGRAVRSVTTVHNGVKPKLRSKILERDGHRCVLCKAEDKPLHAGHVVSVEAGLAIGLSDDEINDEENLIAVCDECNLGQGSQPISLSVAIRILRARISWRDRNETKERS
jgi:5-methylcytosine-specific restriction endonuclease McrA